MSNDYEEDQYRYAVAMFLRAQYSNKDILEKKITPETLLVKIKNQFPEYNDDKLLLKLLREVLYTVLVELKNISKKDMSKYIGGLNEQ